MRGRWERGRKERENKERQKEAHRRIEHYSPVSHAAGRDGPDQSHDQLDEEDPVHGLEVRVRLAAQVKHCRSQKSHTYSKTAKHATVGDHVHPIVQEQLPKRYSFVSHMHCSILHPLGVIRTFIRSGVIFVGVISVIQIVDVVRHG